MSGPSLEKRFINYNREYSISRVYLISGLNWPQATIPFLDAKHLYKLRSSSFNYLNHSYNMNEKRDCERNRKIVIAFLTEPSHGLWYECIIAVYLETFNPTVCPAYELFNSFWTWEHHYNFPIPSHQHSLFLILFKYNF